MKNKLHYDRFKKYMAASSIALRTSFISAFFLSIILILFFNYFIDAFFSFNDSYFTVGEPAKSDYVLKTDFSYYNDLETQIAKEVKSKLALPVYRVDKEKTLKVISSYDFYSARLKSLIGSGLDNFTILKELNSYHSDFLNEKNIDELRTIDLDIFLLKIRIELNRILDRGYSSDIIVGNGSGLLTIVGGGEAVDGHISAASVIKSIDYTKVDNEVLNEYIEKFLNEFITVNCFYDNEQTKYQKDKLLEEVEDVYNHYSKGDLLVRKDIVVSNEDYKRIIKAEDSIKNDFLSSILKVVGHVLLVFIAGVTLFNKSFINITLKERDIILLLAITTFYVAIALVIKYLIYDNYSYLYPLLVPTVLISMLITFLYSNRVSLYLGVLHSCLILLISNYSIYSFLFTLILSIIGAVVVHNIEKRIDLLKSTVELVGISLFLSFFLLTVDLIKVDNLGLYFIVSGLTALVYGVLQLVLLPLSEHALRISTCFQLKELCDLNAPLLKSMLIKAPGTYAHSVAVANMAESAAQHIGANALLAKAGGYYHDIGKVDQPHYFIENQKGGKNIHDDMKPSLSVAVIKSHVKLGIEKAKTIGLPSDILDIIEQHHGKSSIKFFLNKAQNENKGNTLVDDDFRYGGPNPQKPEAAIVMLADSVEAAVRSLKSPTISQLHKFIWELILNKLKDGMLESCGLTLSDLTIIKDSFVNTLVGYYHSRIEYPSGDSE